MTPWFSSRLQWRLPPNLVTGALERARQQGQAILDLTESNPTRAGLRYPESMLAALSAPESAGYEPSPQGAENARAAIASEYRDRGYAVPAGRIQLTASTSESYSYLLKLLCDPGAEILAPRPSYPLFDFLAALETVRVVSYPLVSEARWWIDFHALEAAATPRARAIIVVNPNNPTGSYLDREEAARLAAFCAERQLALISDEVFADYPLDARTDAAISLLDAGAPLAFCLGGLSKASGLPQMKLGWMAVSGDTLLVEEAQRHLEWIADTYLSVGAPVQHALPELLAAGRAVRRQIQERTRANLDFLVKAIAQDSPIRLLPVEAGWYALLRVPNMLTDEAWCLLLLESAGVHVQPGFFYDFDTEGHLVVSLLTPERDFQEGVRRMLPLIEGFRAYP